MTAMERFEQKVQRDPATGCWLWTAKKAHGYGMFWDGRKQVRAHRFAYEALAGPIANGLTIDHLCRVRHCVNPAHLEPVTHKENNLRADSPSTRNAYKTHCDHGHELSGANLAPWKRSRLCRVCERDRKVKWGKKRSARAQAARALDPILPSKTCPNGHNYAEVGFVKWASHRGRICKACVAGRRARAGQKRRGVAA